MIIFKQLSWSNAFSYGRDNTINLQDSPLTQLIGKNGHGKTSIALILEEILYNKNSKGIKKADVLNRYVKDKYYTISVTFDKDGLEYEVITKRGASQSVTLLAQGNDISSHTSTATYKHIESILGMDHKTFAQIVCQFGVDSLQFLTDTDTNRKKFLVELFKLSKYIEIGDSLKTLTKDLDAEVIKYKANVSMCEKWIESNSKFDLTLKQELPVLDEPKELRTQVANLRASLSTMESENKNRITNNQYKKMLDSIVIPVNLVKPQGSIKEWTDRLAVVKSQILDIDKHLTELLKVGQPCRVCGTVLPHDKVDDIITAEKNIQNSLKQEVVNLSKHINTYNLQEAEYKAGLEAQRNFENYHSLYDPNTPSDLLDKETIKVEIAKIETEIKKVEAEIASINSFNLGVSQHNAKVEVIKAQLEQFNSNLKDSNAKLLKAIQKASNYAILVKTFSTTGLIAYKLECLIKDLEDQTNQYLNELSSGRFQLSFKINASDKLNVVITDNGTDVEITALSNGERARVNVATLLGIRKLLQSISSTRVNLLFLDETIENLDVEGKEKLIEVLLQEEYLNTVLVSHGFNHPLLTKIHVTKNNNISRVENG